jgi:hypothetical protein
VAYNPEIVIHEVKSGTNVNGNLPDGVQETLIQGPPYFNGRVEFYGQCTDAGRFASNPRTGTFISSIMFDGAGTTAFTCKIEGTVYPAAAPVTSSVTLFRNNGFTYLQSPGATATVSSWVFHPARPVFVPPGYDIVLTTTGNMPAGGRITFMIGGSWGYRTLQQTGTP